MANGISFGHFGEKTESIIIVKSVMLKKSPNLDPDSFRVRSTESKLQNVQCLRAAAVLMVVLLHAVASWTCIIHWPSTEVIGPIFGGFFDFGWLGVDIFFSISGFIIMWVHGADLGRPERAQVFFLKRIIRIYPVYLILLFIKCVFFLSTQPWGAQQWGIDPAPPLVRIINSVFLLPGPLIIGVAWTLAYEMLFYTMFCLAIILPRRLCAWFIVAWIGAIFSVGIFEIGDVVGIPIFMSAYNLEFLGGALAAWFCRRFQFLKFVPWLVPLGIVAYAAPFLFPEWFGGMPGNSLKLFWPKVMFAGGGFFLISGLVALETQNLWKSPRFLVVLGTASYSIYLTHNELLTVVAKIISRLPIDSKLKLLHSEFLPGVVILLSASLVICLGLIYYRWIERPVTGYLREKGAGVQSCN